MTEDEKFVRAQWKEVDVYLVAEGCEDECIRIMQVDEVRGRMDVLDDWSAAAEFTRTRLAQIREVENELTLLEICDTEELSEDGLASWARILAREQAALADLKRGLRVAE